MPMSNHPNNRRYPREMRERAVRLVHDLTAQNGQSFGAVPTVARQLGIGVESVRLWVKQAEINAGERPGVTTADHVRIVALERENRELRRDNEILKAATSFFARELDPRPPK